MEAVNLCKCNKCDNIFIDQNPQIGAIKYFIDVTKLTNLQYLKDIDNEYYWGCGVCETDNYLTDNVLYNDLQK